MMRSLLRFTLRTLLTLALVAFIGLAIAVRFSWVTFTEAEQENLERKLLFIGLPLFTLGVLLLILFPGYGPGSCLASPGNPPLYSVTRP